ncbi:MAG: HAMP domain-containing sensor histidine kinase [Acidimicrobiales bacterium]
MSLRTRLALVAALLVATVIAALTVIVVRQRTVLIEQLDSQLDAVAANVDRGADLPASVDRARTGPPTGELWFAIIAADATVQVIAQPASDRGFAPQLDLGINPLGTPFTAATVGDSGQARVVLVGLPEDRIAAVAVSLAGVDDTQRKLLVTSAIAVAMVLVVVGLAWFWIDRLSLRPIKAVTAAATEAAAGDRAQHVDHPSITTEAGQLGAAFNMMVDARQAAEDRQRRFVADASHELRTPLTTLRGYTALHAQGGLADPGQVDDAMRRIRSEADRMAVLVEDLLVLASLDDQRPLTLGWLDLTQLLADIAADATAIQPRRPIDITAVAPSLMLHADAHLLTQAVTAVTTNALRHTPDSAALSIAAVSKGDAIEISIADQGPGIDPTELDRLFERFHRTDASRSRTSGGTGLGLAIAQAAVHAHDGTITARSQLGRGTTIVMTIPVAGPAAPTESPGNPQEV